MKLKQLKEKVKNRTIKDGNYNLQLYDNVHLQVYPDSINEYKGNLFFIAKEGMEKYLFIFTSDEDKSVYEKFDGVEKKFHSSNGYSSIKRCVLNTKNRKLVQEFFEFTRPETIGLKNSFGFGDRIGLANPGHIRSLQISNFKPVLAQQSIRELTRTNRTADEVMDAAVWAVFQEGYKNGFGADADHLKTIPEIDLMMQAGYKMLTFDPSDYVDNKADVYSRGELNEIIVNFPWKEMKDTYNESKNRYLDKGIKIDDDLKIISNEIDLMRAYSKYGKALIHINNLNNYLLSKYSDYDYEIEISVDETESVTSVFEHFFIASELTRLGIKFISLAVRFIGDFEKGIDYKGDLKIFKDEYIKHLKITKYFGNYKISLHSGSDKFSVYEVIGSLKDAYTHVKTAGTSYLEALKVVAVKEPALFREILAFSIELYETEKKTYHVSADIFKIKNADLNDDDSLQKLFNLDDARQVLHVCFGRVLNEKYPDGNYIFKNRILKCLKENEELHYKLLIEHFHKHLRPFN